MNEGVFLVLSIWVYSLLYEWIFKGLYEHDEQHYVISEWPSRYSKTIYYTIPSSKKKMTSIKMTNWWSPSLISCNSSSHSIFWHLNFSEKVKHSSTKTMNDENQWLSFSICCRQIVQKSVDSHFFGFKSIFGKMYVMRASAVWGVVLDTTSFSFSVLSIHDCQPVCCDTLNFVKRRNQVWHDCRIDH